MIPRYVVILDYTKEEVLRLKLTDEQRKEAEQYEEFEEYLSELEEVYDFSLSNAAWMAADEITERNIGF